MFRGSCRASGPYRVAKACLSLPLFALLMVSGVPADEAHAGLMHNSSVTPESAYLEYADLFPSAGWVSAQNSFFENERRSSGTLIYSGPGGSLVLMSQHGLLSDYSNPSSLYDNFEFGLGSNSLTDPGESHYADAVYQRAGYSGIEQGPDIAVLFFEEQFITGVAAEIFDGPLSVNDVLGVSGYGDSGTVEAGVLGYTGDKRAGDVRVDDIDFPAVDYISGTFRQPGHPEFLTLGMQLSNGYSGSGAYTDSMLLAAVATSRGSYRYGGRSSLYVLQGGDIAWIAGIKASTIDARVPEPSAAVLLLGASVLASWRRNTPTLSRG